MSNITEGVVTIATLIVGVALLALIVSRNSNTSGVLQAAASGFGNVLNVAVSPVTGGHIGGNLAYPGSSLGSVGGFGGFPALG